MAKKIQKKFIAQPDEATLAKYPKGIRDLIQKGREQRFVTHQELLKVMPEIEDNVILLDEIYTLFMELGIEVIDVKNDLIWGKQTKKNDELTALEESDLNLSDIDEYLDDEGEADPTKEKAEKDEKD